MDVTDRNPVTHEQLAEGYRNLADQMRELTAEMEGTSREADELLGAAPEWKR